MTGMRKPWLYSSRSLHHETMTFRLSKNSHATMAKAAASSSQPAGDIFQ